MDGPHKRPSRLQLVRMDEIDLNGVLFVEFPTAWSLEKSRDVLERLIRLAGQTEINPATIYIAFAEERRRAFERLPIVERSRIIADAWEARAMRIPPPRPRPATPPHPPAPPKPLNLQDWSF